MAKKVFITGASSGIGMQTARLFAEKGWQVAVNARRSATLESLVEELPQNGGHLVCPGDYGLPETFVKAEQIIGGAWGHLNAVVNAAGLGSQVSLIDTPIQEWRTVFDTMVFGGIYSTRLGAKFMQPGGKIVHVTSVHCEKAEMFASAYSMAKAALAQLVRVGAVELAEKGININALAPGFVKTPMSIVDGKDETEGDWFKQNYVSGHHLPLKRAGNPEEIASVAFFLCSDGASYLTGQTITVDGGLTITF